jgi:tRNA(fMet)-specific endonuclease VapC
MLLFVLDTDHITLLQRGHSWVTAHLEAMPAESIAASIISFEEQLRGRLAIVRRATSPDQLAVAYLRLQEMQAFFCAIRLLDFDSSSATIYERLRREYRRLVSSQ